MSANSSQPFAAVSDCQFIDSHRVSIPKYGCDHPSLSTATQQRSVESSQAIKAMEAIVKSILFMCLVLDVLSIRVP